MLFPRIIRLHECFCIWQSFCNAQRVFQTTLAIVASKVNQKAKVNRRTKRRRRSVLKIVLYLLFFSRFFVFYEDIKLQVSALRYKLMCCWKFEKCFVSLFLKQFNLIFFCFCWNILILLLANTQPPTFLLGLNFWLDFRNLK